MHRIVLAHDIYWDHYIWFPLFLTNWSISATVKLNNMKSVTCIMKHLLSLWRITNATTHTHTHVTSGGESGCKRNSNTFHAFIRYPGEGHNHSVKSLHAQWLHDTLSSVSSAGLSSRCVNVLTLGTNTSVCYSAGCVVLASVSWCSDEPDAWWLSWYITFPLLPVCHNTASVNHSPSHALPVTGWEPLLIADTCAVSALLELSCCLPVNLS